MAHTARLAGVCDVAELVRLRAVMFESMGVDPSAAAWQVACRADLEAWIADGRVVAAVVDAPGEKALAASGLAELGVRIPSPTRPAGRHAYVSSFSTDPRWRGQGMARAVLSLLLSELRAQRVRRVELHATPEGEPLYRSLGFVERPGGLEMRLDL